MVWSAVENYGQVSIILRKSDFFGGFLIEKIH